MNRAKLKQIEKLTQIIEDLGWNAIAMASEDGEFHGFIIGEKTFTEGLAEMLTLFDGVEDGGIHFEPEEEVIPESRLKPVKDDDDDPTFH